MGHILISFDGLTSDQVDQVRKRYGQFIQILLKEDKLPRDSVCGCCSLLLPEFDGYDYFDVEGETEYHD